MIILYDYSDKECTIITKVSISFSLQICIYFAIIIVSWLQNFSTFTIYDVGINLQPFRLLKAWSTRKLQSGARSILWQTPDDDGLSWWGWIMMDYDGCWWIYDQWWWWMILYYDDDYAGWWWWMMNDADGWWWIMDHDGY